MTSPIPLYATTQNPLDLRREQIGSRFEASHRDRIGIGKLMWELWLDWRQVHPGASRHQYLQWLNVGMYSGNLYQYMDAGLAASGEWEASTLGSMAEIGRAIRQGMTEDQIAAHLANGDLSEALSKRDPDAEATPGQIRQDAHAALRKVSEIENLAAEELDIRGHALLAVMPTSMLEAANRAVQTGQSVPDAVAEVVRETFSRLAFYDWIHQQPCGICGVTANIEAHHVLMPALPEKVAGRRNHDALIALCRYHHQHAPDAAHGLNSQAAWSERHWGHETAIYALVDHYKTAFLEHIGAMRPVKLEEKR